MRKNKIPSITGILPDGRLIINGRLPTREQKKDRTVGYYMGKSPVEPKGRFKKEVAKMKLGGKEYIPESISYSFSSSWTTSDIPWQFMAIGDGGKKTLHVTKKEDIKFV